MFWRALFGFCFFVLALAPGLDAAPEFFNVATYNVENYLDAPAGTRPMKSAEARAKIRESIRALKADVIALQEVGALSALQELRAALKSEGVDYPQWDWVTGFDTNIHVAVLSKFPIIQRRPHTNENFLLQGRRLHVSRGFSEIDIQVNPGYTFTLLAAHLKSRRTVGVADEAEMREQEALLLREKIDERLAANPNANLIVLGDFNDVKDSRSTKVILGRGAHALIDTRPAEKNGDAHTGNGSRYAPRDITWTHYFGKEDTYSRIDYILLSPGMAHEWQREGTFVLAIPNWGVGSDHRPIVARFVAEDR